MLHPLLTLLFIHVIALSTPGPDTLVVIRESSLNKHNGISCAFGISIGALIYSLLIVLGLSFVLHKYHFIHYVISILGAIYLLSVGIQLLKSKGMRYSGYHKGELKKKKKSVLNGLLTNLSNPKAIIYFTSVFSQFKITGWFQISYTVFAIMVVTFLWFSMIATFISTKKIRALFFQKSILFDRISGCLFLTFSFVLILKMIF